MLFHMQSKKHISLLTTNVFLTLCYLLLFLGGVSTCKQMDNGDEGNRTPVQKPNQTAFYMFMLVFYYILICLTNQTLVKMAELYSY